MFALHVALWWSCALQQTPAVPEAFPEDLVKRFEDTARDAPPTALPWLKQLAEKLPALVPADQKKLLQVYEKTLVRTRKQDPLDLAIALLAEFEKAGDPGAAATLRALKRTTLEQNPGLLAEALLSLARHRDVSHARVLEEYFVHTEDTVFFAAVDAFGEYATAPEKARKDIVEKLLRSYSSTSAPLNAPPPGSQRNAGKPDPFKTGDKDRARKAEEHFEGALAKLTKESSVRGVTQWETWFREARRKRWDKG